LEDKVKTEKPENPAAWFLERLIALYGKQVSEKIDTDEKRRLWFEDWEYLLKGIAPADIDAALQLWCRQKNRFPPRPYEILPLVPNFPNEENLTMPRKNYLWWTSHAGIERMARELDIRAFGGATYDDIRELITERLRADAKLKK
jgi:hypothetical protein